MNLEASFLAAVAARLSLDISGVFNDCNESTGDCSAMYPLDADLTIEIGINWNAKTGKMTAYLVAADINGQILLSPAD